jgi:hypothetical protein
MWKMVKSLATVLLMAIPLWVAIAGFYEYQPASLTVHLEERDVQCFIDGEEYQPESGLLGPVELKAGNHQVIIFRDKNVVFSYLITVDIGDRKEVWASWGPRPAEELPGFQVQEASEAQRLTKKPLSS